MKTSVLLALVSAICLAMLSMPANAQATRTWVSGVGDDANPCSRTAPCKTFAGAISKTATGGEINVLDPGGFGAVTITKALTIRSDHFEAGVLVSGTNGIVVAAGSTGRVVLEGLDIEGLGTGLNGVDILSGQAVYIIRCSIRSFSQNGVNVVSSTAGTRVFIRDSFIERNAGGVNVQGAGVANSASISNTLIDGNTSFAVQVNGASNAIAIVQSILAGSPTGVSVLGGGAVTSFGPSNIITGAGAVTSTTNFK
jgi:Right handed beta helix region